MATITTCTLIACSAEFINNGFHHSFHYSFIKNGVGMIRIDETFNERGEFKERPHATRSIPADLDLTQKDFSDNILLELTKLYKDLSDYTYISQEYKISSHKKNVSGENEYIAIFKSSANLLFKGNDTHSTPVEIKETSLKSLCANIDSYAL